MSTRQHSDSNPFTCAPDPVFGSDNPFEVQHQADDAPAATTYVLQKSGPDVDAGEYERADKQALEVVVLWGDSVLHVDHLTPPRSYYVGEEEQKNLRNDYLVPQDKLGAARAPLVLVDETGTHLVILPGARGWIEVPGQGRTLLENLVARKVAQPCAELTGSHRVALPFGAKAAMSIGDLTFRIGSVAAGRKTTAAGSRDWTSSLFVGLSLAVHAGMMAAMALFTPDLGLADDSGGQ